MMTTTPWRAAAGDTFDNEGFPIITDASSLRAHHGVTAGIWPENYPFTSSVDALVDDTGKIVLSREGKGDTLEFDLTAASREPTPVYLSGRLVAWMRVFDDGEHCFYRIDGSNVECEFPRIVACLAALGNAYVI